MTENPVPRQRGEVRLRNVDNTEDVFDGYLVADETSETDARAKWTELEIYRADDGRWKLYVVGRSLVYHVHDGPCHRGVPTRRERLDPDAEPCTECSPDIRGRDEDFVVDAEVNRYTSHPWCDNPRDIIEQLRLPDGSFTRLAMRLIEKATHLDPDFAAGTRVVRRS